MAQHPRQWVILETVRGNVIVAEQLEDGTLAWEENPQDLQARCAKAVLLSSAECRKRTVTVDDVRGYGASAVGLAGSGPARSGSGRYAQALYSFVSGDAWLEPPGAAGKVPPKRSHAGGAPVTFSLERFHGFDTSLVAAAPVEPVDSQFRRFGGRCLVLRNVLTPDECACLIQEMSQDMEPVQYRHDYRRNDRCIFESSELAELLWRRIQPHVAGLAVRVDVDPARQHLLTEEPGDCPEELRVGYGNEGVWRPCALNECLRFCRYSPGGFFRRHCDGTFRSTEDELSLFTCMFYLNGDLDGGATRFLRIGGALAPESYQANYRLAEDDEVLASVAPEPGLCLLFFQPGLMHEGEDLWSGEKYILRTDVMCRRDPSTKPRRTPQQTEALDLSRQAQAAEERGECARAVGLYRRAFKLDPELERQF